MKPSIIHSIVICLAAFTLPFMVACGSQEEFFPPDVSEIAESTLLLNISTIEGARAGTAELPDNEKMHNVRIIILHPDGTVEHNKFYALDGPTAQHSILLKVASNESKKVFLFANEESVAAVEDNESVGGSLSSFFDSYREGASGFEYAVNNLYFAPDYTYGKYIPMSSCYVVEMPGKGTIEKTFHVVRVATKFTVNFCNLRAETVNVENLSIASHADRNFLMAHIGDSDQNRRLLNGKTWIEWLRDVSDASSENDSYETTEAAGWLKDYTLPAQKNERNVYTHPSAVAVPPVVFDIGHLDDLKAGKESIMFYLPESKNPKTGATDGEQEYTVSIKVEGQTAPFVRTLPNLKALFRNTNVVVNITMDQTLEMTADVIPFTSAAVAPDYGLTRDDFTGYIVGKDEKDNKCWYDGTDGPYYLGPNDAVGNFVTINGIEYLLVYADYIYNDKKNKISGYNRTAYNLHHIIEKNTRKEYLLTPEEITGYKSGTDMYLNKLKQRVWLDSGGDPDPEIDPEGADASIYNALAKVGLHLFGYRVLYEWDRLDWNKARYWGWSGVYPKYWFDVLGNRYPWSEGDTQEKRKAKLGDWVKYLDLTQTAN